jgi:predicted short-subunit dehydrogenase-like oxidoreductase (DUF2520 family)
VKTGVKREGKGQSPYGKAKSQKAKVERGEGSEKDSVSPSSRPSVAIVGAGRLGAALARALNACGYEVKALVARTATSARRAASNAGVKALALSASRVDELPPADILFISTPDDAIAETAGRIASIKGVDEGEDFEGDVRGVRVRARVALHTSGALSSDVLAPLRARGYGVGSMHPLTAVSEAAAGSESLRRAFFCVEGDASAVRVARRVVRSLGGQSFTIGTGDKALYHAAAVMTAGHAVALFDIAAGLLARCGLSRAEAKKILLPLSRSTLDNLARQTPERALTGTFARGDAATVGKHLAALVEADEPEALLAYALLGARSLHLAARARVADVSALKEIARLLASATENRAEGLRPSAGKKTKGKI